MSRFDFEFGGEGRRCFGLTPAASRRVRVRGFNEESFCFSHASTWASESAVAGKEVISPRKRENDKAEATSASHRLMLLGKGEGCGMSSNGIEALRRFGVCRCKNTSVEETMARCTACVASATSITPHRGFY